MLGIPHTLVGGPVRLTARVIFGGQVQRVVRHRVTARRVPAGFWWLALGSPAIDAARAHGRALVTVTIRARLQDGRVWRARLRLRL